MDRRTFLTATAAAAAAPLARPADAEARDPLPTKVVERLDKLGAAAAAGRMPLTFDGLHFSGAGFDWLLKRGGEAHAFLIGEEHGIAENPKLAAALFGALVPHKYRYVAVEVSPPMAGALDRALAGGGDAFDRLLKAPESRVPFFGMREEADWLRAARRAAPAAPRQTLDKVTAASIASWARYEETKNPQFVFSFAGDPRLVEAVEQSWPR